MALRPISGPSVSSVDEVLVELMEVCCQHCDDCISLGTYFFSISLFSLYRVRFQTFRTPLPIMFLFRSVVLVRIQGHKMSTKSTANEIAEPESGEVDFAANKGEEGGERYRDKVIGGG